MAIVVYNDKINHALSTAIGILSPFYTKKYSRVFTVGSNTYNLEIPSSLEIDPADFVAEVTVTAETGTTPTMAITLQDCYDPWPNYTQINDAAGLTTSGTSLVVDDASGIPNAVTPILLVSFRERFPGVYEIATMEQVQSTSKSSNTLTIDRSIYADENKAFSDNDFVFYGLDWATVTDNAGNAITKSPSIDGATSSAPITVSLSLSEEGLDGLKKPFVRMQCGAPSSGSATYTGRYVVRTR